MVVCLRKWSSENPIVKQREKKPLLPPRSKRSHHCAICVANIYNNHPSDTAGGMETKFISGEISQESYNESQVAYIDGQNGEAPRSKRMASSPRGAKMDVVKTKSLKMTKNLGVFWEQHQWDVGTQDARSGAYQQPTCHKSELFQLPLDDGSKLKGVIRDERFGKPIGTWTINEELQKSMRLIHDVADTSKGGDPLSVWKTSSKTKFVTVGTTNVGTKEAPAQTPTVKVNAKTKISADDDFSFMDELMAVNLGGASSSKQREPKASPKKAAAKGNQERKELNASETVALQVKHLLRDAEGPQVSSILRVARLSDKLDQVRKRLEPALLPLYSADAEIGAEATEDASPGMALLAELRSAERKLKQLKVPR